MVLIKKSIGLLDFLTPSTYYRGKTRFQKEEHVNEYLNQILKSYIEVIQKSLYKKYKWIFNLFDLFLLHTIYFFFQLHVCILFCKFISSCFDHKYSLNVPKYILLFYIITTITLRLQVGICISNILINMSFYWINVYLFTFYKPANWL